MYSFHQYYNSLKNQHTNYDVLLLKTNSSILVFIFLHLPGKVIKHIV